MDIEVKLEKNPEILAKLNKSVHELQQSWYPTIFRNFSTKFIKTTRFIV
jgi:hypothetical protein